MNHYQGVPARVSYPATLDVPESIAHAICLWLAAHRRAHGREALAQGGHLPGPGPCSC